MIDSATGTGITIAKTTGYVAVVGVFQYLNIPAEQFAILSSLMVFDFITGVGKQFRVDKKQIKSHLAWLGLMKKVATLLCVLSIALVLKGMEIEEHKYVSTVLAIFITAEGYSILQNVYAIRTGKILPEFDVLSIAIREIGEFFKQRIESYVRSTLPPDDSDKNSK